MWYNPEGDDFDFEAWRKRLEVWLEVLWMGYNPIEFDEYTWRVQHHDE